MKKKIILPDFIIIPYILLEDSKVTLIDERLYGIIYWFSKLKNEKCTASNALLARLVRTTPTTVQNSLTRLENRGYVARIFSDEARKKRQEIVPLVVFSRVSLTDDTKAGYHSEMIDVSLTDDTRVSLRDDQKKNIVNKNSKGSAEASSATFDFQSIKEEMKNGGNTGKRKDLKIIALYWDFKKFEFENKAQYQSQLKRDIRAAKLLEGYTSQQIKKTMLHCEENYQDVGWTLETCWKRIAEVIKK